MLDKLLYQDKKNPARCVYLCLKHYDGHGALYDYFNKVQPNGERVAFIMLTPFYYARTDRGTKIGFSWFRRYAYIEFCRKW